MISSYPTTIATAAITTVDCHKQVQSWRLLRSLVELLIPTCNCTFIENDEESYKNIPSNFKYSHHHQSSLSSPSIVTGTIFGYRRGKVNFCIQTNPKSGSTPILLLELAISTSTLAREMQGGIVRIALESGNKNGGDQSFLRMYCNGKKVGFAMKRKPKKSDLQVLGQMELVNIGAGIIHGKKINYDDDIMYLRGKFERVHGSYNNSESFHLIDPEGSMGQELSIFFLSSRCRRV